MNDQERERAEIVANYDLGKAAELGLTEVDAANAAILKLTLAEASTARRMGIDFRLYAEQKAAIAAKRPDDARAQVLRRRILGGMASAGGIDGATREMLRKMADGEGGA